jgi:peptide chain release factor 1
MALELPRKKLDELASRYEELGQQLMDPVVSGDPRRYRQVNQAWNDLKPVTDAYRNLLEAEKQAADAESLLGDAELGDLAAMELSELRESVGALTEKIKLLLLPSDPNDAKDVLLEIRPAAGGEEAALFAGDLMRMYSRYAERRGWKVELMSAQESGIGGFSDVVISIQAQGAYSQLKFESGVHRVQRVPATESSGRIHTSTATVAVLPEAEEVEIEINPGEIQMDVYHSSSAGGQNVQKVATAIRILHKPTGIVVTCQDERSQLQNKEKATRMLRARLFERETELRQGERTATRRSQVGSGDRSEKIRTYNYPDGRVTDHRIGLTVHNIPSILDGDIQRFVDALVTADQAERLRAEAA